jgi:hypothetical protein
MKKVFIIAAIVLCGVFVVFVVPRLIADAAKKEALRMEQLEENAKKKASEMTNKIRKRPTNAIHEKYSAGVEGEFGDYQTHRAQKNANKAMNRSADFMKNLEEDN